MTFSSRKRTSGRRVSSAASTVRRIRGAGALRSTIATATIPRLFSNYYYIESDLFTQQKRKKRFILVSLISYSRLVNGSLELLRYNVTSSQILFYSIYYLPRIVRN